MISENNPVVSVIVPARNEEACLGACLESLVSQQGVEFEIIVVDDASTDRTAEIAHKFVHSVPAQVKTGKPTTSIPESTTSDGKGTTSSRADRGISLILRDDSPANHPASSETSSVGSAASRTVPTAANKGVSADSASCSTKRVGADVHVRPPITLIPAPKLPDGWTGKNNAMAAGAKVAKGKWLLFTDADTVHKPGSLARAVAEAEQHGAALLSYSPEQEVRTFWEKAVMPVIFAELGATYPPKKVRDPSSPIAAANGQYLLISCEAYDAVGGHTAITGDLLDDVAMARLVKSSGRRIFFRYGGDAVRTRMYRSWLQMKEGWTKNLALLFRHPVWRAILLLAFWALSWASFIVALVGIASVHWPALGYVLPLLFLYGRVAWGRFNVRSNFAAITVGIPMTAYLLFRSALLHKRGAVTWRGRKYIVEA